MNSTEKIYIGKGNQVKDYDMLSIVINLSIAKGQTFIAKNGDTLLRFTIARTKNPDSFGRTHTAYVTPMPSIEEPVTKKKGKAKAHKLEPSFSNH